MLIHRPSNTKYENRKEAKTKMGHYDFNKALKRGEFVLIHDKNDIIF